MTIDKDMVVWIVSAFASMLGWIVVRHDNRIIKIEIEIDKLKTTKAAFEVEVKELDRKVEAIFKKLDEILRELYRKQDRP